MSDRYDDWDIVSGIGISALAVAAGRAIVTHRDSPLVRDVLAEAFVVAANPPTPMPTRPSEAAAADPDGTWEAMATAIGLRSKFFDGYIEQAVAAGTRQAVLLAAGLDCRAFRLAWPSGYPVFEVDQPRVLTFKDRVLREQRAEPRCQRRVVPADLRADWASALRDSGFDPAKPTAWLAEGLLPYLPADAERQLLETISRLSAPGSHLAVEYFTDMPALRRDPHFSRMAKEIGIDVATVFEAEPRPHPADHLAALGWYVRSDFSGVELADRYHCRLDPDLARGFAHNSGYLTARRPEPGTNR